MKIAETILARQNIKEMTRRAIKILIASCPNDNETIALQAEFEREYGEKV